MTADRATLSAHLTAFRRSLAGVTDVLAIAGTGLCVAADSPRPPDEIDQLAARIHMVNAMASAAAQLFEGAEVLNTAIQGVGGYLALMKVHDGLLLAALGTPSCDIGQVVHDLCLLCDHLAATS